MKKIALILIFLSFTASFAQINVDEIKTNAKANPQEYFLKYLDVFRLNPSKLAQEQMNQMYYGSRFVKTEYSLSDFNDDYDKIWKVASKKGLSMSKAQKILAASETAYYKNPLNLEILASMVNIYNVLGEKEKAKLCVLQNNTIIKTIDESGTGESENLPICVITADDMISFGKPVMMRGRQFKQKDLKTEESCMLTEYSNGEVRIFVKCIGCFEIN